MCKILKRILSMLLSVILLFSLMPTNILAVEEIIENAVKKIAVSNLPDKTTYVENSETLDVTGGEVEIFYEDSSTEKVDMTLDMITGFDNTVIGKQELTVTYLGCTTAFEVEIIEMSTTDVPETEEYQIEEQETTEEYSEEIIVETVEAEPNQSEFAGGDGTSDNPYLISTYDQLNNMRNYLSANFKLVNDIEIPEESSTWTPVGSSSAPFTGTLDGAGNKIIGLRISFTDSKNGYAGLFAYIENGSIINLGMEDTNIAVSLVSNSSAIYVGGIAGYISNGNIDNSYNTGSIEIIIKSTYKTTAFTGGIVGYIAGNLSKCHNNAVITVSSSSSKNGLSQVDVFAGGNVGYVVGDLTDCYNTGSIKGTAYSRYATSNSFVGGISGNVSSGSEFRNCYNTGEIISEAESPIRESSLSTVFSSAGGIAGRIDKNGSLNGCYNNGYVSATAKATATVGYSHAGGIVGTAFDNCVVRDCYNTGKILSDVLSNISNTYGISSMYAYSRVGGILGYSENGSDISSSYNTGTLKATITSIYSMGYAYAGGIVAKGNDCNIVDCDNTGEIVVVSREQATDITMPTGNYAYAGGIAGNISGSINDCNNSGCFDVTSTSLDDDYAYIGGIAGYLNGTIKNSNNSGSATGLSGNFGYAGGISGYTRNGSIKNCCNSGFIDINSYDSSYAGGITGRAEKNNIESCYNIGNITAISKTTSNMPCASYAGGITGLIKSNTISKCYNCGDITTSVSSSANYNAHVYSYAGGISGYMMTNSKITDCYNTGNATAKALRRFVYHAYAGGILGYGYDSYGSIENCYNIGNLVSELNSGGIAGAVQYGSVKNCYYLDNISVGIDRGSGDTTSCTINDMQQEGTYFGFDFDTVWIMDGSDSYLLPKLQGMEQGGEKTLTSIELTSVPIKTKYLQGKDSLDITGGKLTLKYSDGTSEVIDLSADMVSGFDNSKVGKQTLTITYSGKTTSYDVEIIAKSLSRIEVSTLPDKTKYFQNKENLDVKGGKITLYYNDNSSEIIDMTEAMVSGFDNTKTGFQTLTVTYNGKTATFKVEIIVKSVSSITVSTLPDKIEYTQNQDSLDVTGGKITVNYNDGTSEIINLTSDMVSGFDNSAVGTKTLTVTYGGKSTTYKIEIVESSENEFAGGDGTEDNPYLISTMEHLDNVRKYPSAYFKLLKDISIISIPNWEPIDLYSGNFDGNGHYIYGLRINVPEAENYSDFGLFGHVGDSVIKNLGVVDSEISVEVSGSNSDLSVNVGGIAGIINNTTIENCYFDGNITTSAASFSEYDYATASVMAGGISGFVYGSNSVISECYNISNIKATANAESSYDYSFVGGIAGDLNEGEIKNCYNIGNMYSDGYSGGISGKTNGTENNPMGKIINCYNIGEVISTDYYSGGISGVIYGSVENCYYIDLISKGTESGSGDMTCCTLEEMKHQETFERFDFETVWTMEGEDKYLLPKLRRTDTIFTKSLYSIEVSTLPNKTEYIAGTDNFDVAGGKLTLNYNTGTSEIIDLTSDMISGFDNNKEGTQILTVTYGEKTTTFEVTVVHIHISDGDWHFDDDNHWKICTDANCGEIVDSTKAEHDFVWIIDKQATQEETGLMHEECSVCGYIRNENTEIPVLDHVHFGIEHHDALEATCHSTGNIEYWTCSSNQCSGKYYIDADCKTEIKTITIPINPENHDGETEIQNYIKETCTEDGYSGDVICKSCGMIIEEGVLIPKHGHVYENGECIECGLKDPSFIIGDVNMDGVIAIIDATLIQYFIANIGDAGDFNKTLADVDGDGIISTEDATLVQLMVANLKS